MDTRWLIFFNDRLKLHLKWDKKFCAVILSKNLNELMSFRREWRNFSRYFRYYNLSFLHDIKCNFV